MLDVCAEQDVRLTFFLFPTDDTESMTNAGRLFLYGTITWDIGNTDHIIKRILRSIVKLGHDETHDSHRSSGNRNMTFQRTVNQSPSSEFR